MIKECKHRWHFVREWTDYTYIDTGRVFADGDHEAGWKIGDTSGIFICDECGKIKKVKEC